MKCPEFNKLIDLIDGKLNKSESEKAQAHVSGCSTCAEKVEWVRSTFSMMQRSDLVDAPEFLIQRAIAAFPKKKMKFSDWVTAKLDTDSWMAVEMAGVRSETAGPRQRVYQTESYKIILMSEPQRFIGQILSDRPGVETAGCLVELTSGKRVLGATVTNQNGEFMLPAIPKKNLQLKIHGQAEAVFIANLI